MRLHIRKENFNVAFFLGNISTRHPFFLGKIYKRTMTDIDGKWIRDGTITMKDRVVFLKINDGSMVYIMDPKEEEEVMFFHLFHYILFQTVVLSFLLNDNPGVRFVETG